MKGKNKCENNNPDNLLFENLEFSKQTGGQWDPSRHILDPSRDIFTLDHSYPGSRLVRASQLPGVLAPCEQ